MANELDIRSPAIADDIHTALDVSQGAPMPKLKRLETFDEDAWEDITLELVHHWKTQYQKAYLKNGGSLEKAAVMANHTSTRTTQLYNRRHDEMTLDEVEKIGI